MDLAKKAYEDEVAAAAAEFETVKGSAASLQAVLSSVEEEFSQGKVSYEAGLVDLKADYTAAVGEVIRTLNTHSASYNSGLNAAKNGL